MSAVVIADPKPLKEFYTRNGYMPSNLDKCNSQEICRGAQIGKGYFLTTADKWDGDEHISITLFPNTVALSLTVLDSLEIDYNHIILETAEPKQELLYKLVGRDYNVLDQAALPAILYFLPEADQTATVTTTATGLTFQEIINDILSGSGYTADHTNAAYPAFLPMNVFVSGRNILDALEYICAAIGRTYYVRGTVFHISQPAAPDLSQVETFEKGQTISSSLAVAFNVNNQFGDNQTIRGEYYVVQTDPVADIGLAQAAYFPFAYELRDEDGVVTNATDLSDIFTWLVSSYNLSTSNTVYTVPEYDSAYQTRFFESVTFIDKGDRPLTIYRVSPLPLLSVPPSPPISQSISLFQYTQTTNFASGQAHAAIYDADTEELKNSSRKVIDPTGDLEGTESGSSGVGIRFGEKFYAIPGSGVGSNPTWIDFTLTSDMRALGDADAVVNAIYGDTVYDLSGNPIIVGSTVKVYDDNALWGDLIIGCSGKARHRYVGSVAPLDSEFAIHCSTRPQNKLVATLEGQLLATDELVAIYSTGLVRSQEPFTVAPPEIAVPFNAANPLKLHAQPSTLVDIERVRLGIEITDPPETVYWRITAVRTPWPRKIIGTLDADMTDTEEVTVNPIKAFGRPYAPIDVQGHVLPGYSDTHHSPFGVFGWKSGDLATLEYCEEENIYYIIDVKGRATRVKGTVVSNFLSTDATFSINTLVGLNGPAPTSPLTIQNIHDWSGTAGDLVRVEANLSAGTWEAYQKDC